jgi:hypothetical protein
MATDRHYNSTLAGKGTYLPETKTVLREIDRGKHLDQVRQAVIEDLPIEFLGCYVETPALTRPTALVCGER